MKKVIISVIVSIIMMLLIPFIIVEFSKPEENADSTGEIVLFLKNMKLI